MSTTRRACTTRSCAERLLRSHGSAPRHPLDPPTSNFCNHWRDPAYSVNSWINTVRAYTLFAILAYGVWGAVSSLESQSVPALTLQIVSTIGLIPAALVLAFSKNLGRGVNHFRGILLAVATGILGGTGNLTLYETLRVGGKASVVFPLTGMYPLVTIIMARLLLKERLNRI